MHYLPGVENLNLFLNNITLYLRVISDAQIKSVPRPNQNWNWKALIIENSEKLSQNRTTKAFFTCSRNHLIFQQFSNNRFTGNEHVNIYIL